MVFEPVVTYHLFAPPRPEQIFYSEAAGRDAYDGALQPKRRATTDDHRAAG